MNPQATINLQALRHNVRVITGKTSAKLIAMIKANAYGHGLEEIASLLDILPEVKILAVARAQEAILLRQKGVQKDLLVMSGFLNPAELQILIGNNCQFVVHNFEQIACLENWDPQSLTGARLIVWLKLDLGMHRLGFLETEANQAYQKLKALSFVELRVMTHFPNAGRGDEASIQDQKQHFLKLTEHWSCEKSLANSALLLLREQAHYDWVRPGIMLYGVSPFTHENTLGLGLQAVMTLRAPVIAVRHFKQGDPIGYDGTFICPEDMPVAIVGIGYGDGYPRHAQSGTPVLLQGKHCPLIGRVSMDMIAVDVRGLSEVSTGEMATLWGEGLPIELVADSADTIPYELFCRLSSRVEFEYA